MTRKKALQEVVKIVEKLEIDEHFKKELLQALSLCLTELPYTKWSHQAILDACAQHISDYGTLTVNDFQKSDLPTHSVVKLRFGMTVTEFREKYFPEWDQKPPYPTEQVFLNEYERIRPTSRGEYDKRRTAGTPTVTTILSRLNIGTWDELKQTYGLPTYHRRRRPHDFVVTTEHEVDRFDHKHKRG